MVVMIPMKFLRVLVNSLLCGVFMGTLLALLIYDLNINLPFKVSVLAQLVLFTSVTYGLIVAIFCLVFFFLVQYISGKTLPVRLFSPSFLIICFAFLSFIFLIVFKDNKDSSLSLFDDRANSALGTQFLAVLGVGVLGLIAFYAFHRYKKNPLIYALYFVLLGFAIFACFFLRARFHLPQRPLQMSQIEAKTVDKRITVLGMEGLSLDFLIPLIAEGKLPNFSWLFEEGSWGKLVSLSPNEPFILTNSFNTGKLPSKHRQVSIWDYRLFTSAERFECVPRHILFKQLKRLGLLEAYPSRPAPAVKDIWSVFSENGANCLIKDWPYGRDDLPADPRAEKAFLQSFKEISSDRSPQASLLRQAFLSDLRHEEEAFQQKAQGSGGVFYLLLNGLNTVEAYFYRYSFPDLFGTGGQEEMNKFGPVLERYYMFYDQIVGKYLAGLKEDELLVVYSPHGIEPLPSWKRIIEWSLGNPDVSAYHENAPDGVFFFYGKGILRGSNIEGMKLVDIAPTLLYYEGLAVPLDMDGVVMSSVFSREFKSENPIFPISSYEAVEIKK